MSDPALPSFWSVIANTFVIIVNAALLVYLFVIVPSACAEALRTSRGMTSCGLEPGAYVFGAVFVLLALYAGYDLFAVLFPEKKASCPVCNILSKK